MTSWRPWKSYCLLFLVITATCLPVGYLIWTLSKGRSEVKKQPPQPSYPVEYSPGIIINEVSPAPIYYETYIPLILEHELPNFEELLKSDSDLGKSSLCRNARKFSGVNFNFCKEDAEQHLWKTSLKKVLSALESRIWVNKDNIGVGSEQKLNYEKSIEFCSKIEGHFKDSVMESKSFQKYLKSIESCRSDRFLTSIIFKNSFNITDITKVLKNSRLSDSDLSFYETTVINLVKLVKKWEARFENCKSDRIVYNPFAYSSENVVQKKALADLDDRLFSNDIHELSIPYTDFEMYQSLPSSLTDCVFSTNNTFVERILLPIVPQKANYLTFSVKAIPFLVKSPAGSDQVCYLRNTDDKKFIYEEKSQRFMQISSCESQSLCQIPKTSEFKTLSELNCISAVFFNNTDNIAKFCQFECQHLQGSGLFKRVSSNSIVLFSVVPNEIQFFYRCDDGLSIPISTTISDVASLKITLPCNCKLYKNFDQIFQSISPCTNKSVSDSQVVQIIPLDILKLDVQSVNTNLAAKATYESDLFFVSVIVFFIIMLLSLFYKIGQQETRIQTLSNWHENQQESRIQYFNDNIRIFNDITEILNEKK